MIEYGPKYICQGSTRIEVQWTGHVHIFAIASEPPGPSVNFSTRSFVSSIALFDVSVLNSKNFKGATYINRYRGSLRYIIESST